MKKSIIVFVLLVIGLISCNTKEKNQEEVTEDTELNFTDEHTAQNSLDWMGEYEGVLPCADCEGIRTIVVLNENGTFTSKQIYVKEPVFEVENQGSFTWDETGFIITLKPDDGNIRSYRVVEGAIILLDNEGKEITGELAEYYRLTKKL